MNLCLLYLLLYDRKKKSAFIFATVKCLFPLSLEKKKSKTKSSEIATKQTKIINSLHIT